MSLSPQVQQAPVPGLIFDRGQGHQFRPLTSPSGDFYWKPNLMAVVRRCADLAYFLPGAEFSDAGAKVVFTRFSGNDELLTKTVGLDEPGVKMPESTYNKMQEALAKFKAMANDPGFTPDESRFISEFRLPDRHQFPGAYRILKTSWYTSDRLFVVWGLEPSTTGGVPVIKILAGAGNAPSSRLSGERKAEGEQGSKPGGASTVPPVVPIPGGLPPKSPGADQGAAPIRGAVPVGSGSGAGMGGGAGGNGSATLVAGGVGHGGSVVSEGGWRRRGCWRGCLWLLLLAFLLGILLLLLSQCTPTGCSDETVRTNGSNPSPAPRKPEYYSEKPVPSPERPSPLPPPSSPSNPTTREWWKEEAQTEEKTSKSGRVMPLDKRKPIAPGKFEVYIHQPTELVQRPPAVGLHLGLRYHGEGQVKGVTWTLADGVKEQGEFLDELVPFDRDLVASTEIDITYTYVDANGVEKEDGFSFRYVLEGKVTFSERITDPEDRRTPAQKEAERKGEREKEAATKGI